MALVWKNIGGQMTRVEEFVDLPYDFSTDVTDTDPGSGLLKFNNATYASVTEIYINDGEMHGLEISAVLGAITTSDVITIKSTNNPTNAISFTVSGAITDNTQYYTIPVTFVSQISSTSFTSEPLNFGIKYIPSSAGVFIETIVDKTFANFTAAGTTHTEPLYLTAAKEMIYDVIQDVTTVFDVVTTPTTEVGMSGDTALLAKPADMLTADFYPNSNAETLSDSGTTMINATIKSAAGNLNTMTAGVIRYTIISKKF